MDKINIFISYSRKDSTWAKRFADHFKSRNLPFWYDIDNISPGDRWNQEIEDAILKANIAVVLISVNFMNSDYIKNKELPEIEKKYEKNELKIFPIYLSSCSYEDENKFKWLAAIQRFPNSNDMTTLEEDKNNPEKHVDNIVKEINKELHPEETNAATNKYKNRLVPPLVPYLVNRNQQTNKMLIDINKNINKDNNFFNSPIIWIIHGDNNQSHYKLIEGIEKYFWEKKIYKTHDNQAGVITHRINWSFEDRKPEKRKSIIEVDLQNKFCINDQDVSSNINKRCDERPMLLYCDCDTDEWKKNGQEDIILEFVNFWQNTWPAHDFMHPLICCLIIKYNEAPKKSWIKSLFKSKNKIPTNDLIKSFIKNNNKNNAYCEIPELKDVAQIDAERWGKEFETTIRRYWEGPDIDEEIKNLYENDELAKANEKKMPMKKLGKKLYEKFFKGV